MGKVIEIRKWLRDAELIKLHALGLDDYEIGERMDVEAHVVRKHRLRLELPLNRKPAAPPLRWDKLEYLPEDKPSPLALAKVRLNVTERDGMYWIGNTPHSVIDIMKKYNGLRVRDGLPQILKNPLWKAE
jgi:hypothetical protein